MTDPTENIRRTLVAEINATLGLLRTFVHTMTTHVWTEKEFYFSEPAGEREAMRLHLEHLDRLENEQREIALNRAVDQDTRAEVDAWEYERDLVAKHELCEDTPRVVVVGRMKL